MGVFSVSLTNVCNPDVRLLPAASVLCPSTHTQAQDGVSCDLWGPRALPQIHVLGTDQGAHWAPESSDASVLCVTTSQEPSEEAA